MRLSFLSRWRNRSGGSPPGSAHASAYRVDSRLVICASSVTTTGLHVDDGPRFSPPIDDAVAVGESVLRAIRGARTSLPHPQDFKALIQPTLQAAGVSHRRFNATAQLVMVQSAGGRLIFTPTQNLGARGGFEGDNTQEVIVIGGDPETVGRGLLQAFARAV